MEKNQRMGQTDTPPLLALRHSGDMYVEALEDFGVLLVNT
jgi:hypothetical protein